MSTEKAEAFATLLQNGNILLAVLVDNEGVILPDAAKARSQAATVERNGVSQAIRLVNLEYGYQMAKPIPDLKIDETGVSATLSFDQTPHFTFVPWSAMAFAQYLPGSDSAPSRAPTKPAKRARHLYAVLNDVAFDPELQTDDGAPDSDAANDSASGAARSAPFRLELVK